jgi:hypothetical protein
VALLAAGCGGDGGSGVDRSVTPLSPAGTKAAAVSPGSPSGQPVAPTPPPPTLKAELDKFGEGQLTAEIAAGGAYDLDPAPLIVARGGSAPSCSSGNVSFAFTWQVSDPYPPDNVSLTWQLSRAGRSVKVAEGPFGDIVVPCGPLEAVNQGPADITVQIRYAIGAVRR